MAPSQSTVELSAATDSQYNRVSSRSARADAAMSHPVRSTCRVPLVAHAAVQVCRTIARRMQTALTLVCGVMIGVVLKSQVSASASFSIVCLLIWPQRLCDISLSQKCRERGRERGRRATIECHLCRVSKTILRQAPQQEVTACRDATLTGMLLVRAALCALHRFIWTDIG
jgi:hypothetical protein